MSLVLLYLPEDALRVLIFVIRQLESEAVRLQASLDDHQDRFKSLEMKYEAMLDQSLADMYDMHQRVDREEMKARIANEYLEQMKASNNELEGDNEALRLEVDMLKTHLHEQQNGH
ncbi:hypothetical protein HYPSUDRAFT_59020 [Hypholoma sublateritium FD-334 SS-4]|uniref:Uncharacterized protein n=1 Tax=Hypholoma sublateritium (strain FD-334 SS-4) TaxID=945553 RepID=A0A0D2NEF7_HYPSF|nr:hypothetical protein HYPSUDRAFT_59020 [Hypholoma sublateritium FD-334 SS-4]